MGKVKTIKICKIVIIIITWCISTVVFGCYGAGCPLKVRHRYGGIVVSELHEFKPYLKEMFVKCS